jgi:hypothetical protein
MVLWLCWLAALVSLACAFNIAVVNGFADLANDVDSVEGDGAADAATADDVDLEARFQRALRSAPERSASQAGTRTRTALDKANTDTDRRP